MREAHREAPGADRDDEGRDEAVQQHAAEVGVQQDRGEVEPLHGRASG